MPRQISREEIEPLHAHNIRTDLGDEADLRRLGESLKQGQINPIIVTKGGKIIAGHRRVAAAKLVGLQFLDAIVVDDNITDDEIADLQLTEVLHSKNLPDIDKAVALQAMKQAKGLTNAQLAEKLKADPGTITRQLSVFSKCIPAVLEAAKAGKIGLRMWYAISRRKDQEQALQEALHGATCEQVEKPPKDESADTEKVDTLKITLPNAVVTIKAEGLTLGSGSKTLARAMKAVDAALAEGLCSSTAMNVWADTAKKAKAAARVTGL